jgi:pantoate--beta-alanine ligase
VASVVTRLFNIVRPDTAVFGQKDYQQLVVIRRLQADLHLPVRIVAGPTVREADGLARSSRNQYLTTDDRLRAPGLHRALADCAARIDAGKRSFRALEKQGTADLVAAGFRPDYFAIRNAADLSAVSAESRSLVIMAAARVGRARLIDNLLVELKSE